METRLTFLLMILAKSVLPKVSGIWVQLSTIRSHRMLTSTIELELELIQTQMTQKPMLRAEVYARALRASQNRKEDSL